MTAVLARTDARAAEEASARNLRVAGAAPARDPHQRLEELSRSRTPVRRALCRVTARFVRLRGSEVLGFARLRDYGMERLGLSARSLQDLARVDAALAELPGVERAFVSGEIRWTKTRLLCRVATAQDEVHWIERARRLSARELSRQVRAVDTGSLEAGAGSADAPLDEDGAPERARTCVRLRCGPTVAAKWRRARQLARRVAGEKLAEAECLELILAEVSSAIPVEGDPDEPMFAGPAVGLESGRRRPRRGSRAEPARGSTAPGTADGCASHAPREVELEVERAGFLAPLVAGLDAADAFELDSRLRRLVALEQRLDTDVAALLLDVAERRSFRDLGFQSLDRYVRERLGLSPRKARELLRLERAARRAPALREAFRSARLSAAKAQVLAPLAHVEGAPVESWIQRAERMTLRRLEEDAEQALPPPQLLIFGVPRPIERFFRAVLCSVRRRLERETGTLPSPEQAFEAMLDHVLACWAAYWDQLGPRVRRAHRVFARDGWRCTVPGCSSFRNLQDHHVVFRSAGGSDDPSNRTTLCAWHHQRGVHAARIRVTGVAPDGLRFDLGLRPPAPPLIRYDAREAQI